VTCSFVTPVRTTGVGATTPASFLFVEGILSWQAASFVTAHSEHKGSYLLTLLMIANHAHADGTGAWPSIATLAKETRMSERGVQYCIQKLKESGELEVIPDGGPKGVNGYRIVGMTQSLRDERNGVTQSSTTMTQDLPSSDAIAIAPKRKEPSLEKSPPSAATNMSLVMQAIQESHRTGEEADAILKRLRSDNFIRAEVSV
jgi:biotin operon repressor